jgi:hypothetical protein
MKRVMTFLSIACTPLIFLISCATLDEGSAGGAGTDTRNHAMPVVEQPQERSTASAAEAGAAAETPDPYKDATNLGLGRPILANNHIYAFTAPKAVDGDVLTYWEGAASSYPNEITVDLGEEKAIAALRLKLNPNRIWQARKQTISVLLSADGNEYAAALAPADYVFDPRVNTNTVTIPLQGKAEFIRLVFSANDGATGGQIAEWEVFGE